MLGAVFAFLIHVFSIIGRPLVLVYAIRGRYPWWMITPDDLPSYGPHFGYYEPTVRRVYERLGRYVGDVYWLACRNVLYGLRYRFKPAALLPRTDERGVLCYAHLRREFRWGRWVDVYCADGYGMVRIKLPKGLSIIAGWKVDRIVDDPYNERTQLNMDGRPILSLRRG